MASTDFGTNGIEIETKRKVNAEFACAGLFYSVVLIQIILSFVIFASKNSEVVEWDDQRGMFVCPDGYDIAPSCVVNGPGRLTGMNYCVKPDLCQEIRDCTSGSTRRLAPEDVNLTAFHESVASGEFYRQIAEEEWPASPRRLHERDLARRRLQNRSTRGAKGLWDLLEGNLHMPIAVLLCAVILGVIWLVFLAKASKIAIWGSIVFDVVALVAVFIWYKVEFDVFNWACLIMALILVIAAVMMKDQINKCAEIMKIAMEGLSENRRIFAVSTGVQLVWICYLALFIASVVGMHFVKQVARINSPYASATMTTYECELQAKGWIGNGWVTFIWTVCYYWATAFCANTVLMLVTANLAGWYFKQDGFKYLWVKALRWAVFEHAGGNSLASAISGVAQYLLDRVGNKWKLVFSVLGPWNWILLCLACCLQAVVQAYTQFATIAMTYSGRSFFESAALSLRLLQDRMGTAMLTNFLGRDVMTWACYVISLAVGFGSWAWSDDLQGYGSSFADMEVTLLILLIILFAYMLAYPFLTVIVIILLEPFIASNLCGSSSSGSCHEFQTRVISVMCGLFLSCLTMFILQAISHIVVSAMNIVLFCYAVEDKAGEKQERFSVLYENIKSIVVVGVVQGDATQSQGEVVIGSAVAGSPPSGEAGRPQQTPVVVGNALSNNRG